MRTRAKLALMKIVTFEGQTMDSTVHPVQMLLQLHIAADTATGRAQQEVVGLNVPETVIVEATYPQGIAKGRKGLGQLPQQNPKQEVRTAFMGSAKCNHV